MRRNNLLIVTLLLANVMLLAASALLLWQRTGNAQDTSPPVTAPQLISYQGYLVNAGNPVTGTKDLVFRVFDQATNGTLLWQEAQNGVPISAGEFSVLLGSTATPSGTLPLTLFDEPNRWVEIEVAKTTLTPRQRFASVPYALNAARVGGKAPESLALPKGAVVWLPEASNPTGFTRLPGLGQDVGPWSQTAPAPSDFGPLNCDGWTGSEVICFSIGVYGSPIGGASYNPTTDTWTKLPTTGAPPGGSKLWTGQELIVWNGYVYNGTTFTSAGARYNPTTNAWTPMSNTNAPSDFLGGCAAWTGQEMIVWNGRGGGRYNPATDTWTAMSTTNAPQGQSCKAIWTGQDLIFAYSGGNSSDTTYYTRYNPTTNSWTPISSGLNFSSFKHIDSVWTGSEVAFLLGRNLFNTIDLSSNFVVFYNPTTDTWRTLATPYTISTLGRLVVTSDGKRLITSAKIYDLSTSKWIASWDNPASNLFANGQEILSFPNDGTFKGGMSGNRHTIQLVFPYAKD